MRRFRRLAGQFLPRILIRAVRFAKQHEATDFRGLDGLDRALGEHLDVLVPGFFVELGANDGLRQSNTYFLEALYGWQGVLIEPALNNYLDLLQNRSVKNAFFCCACVPFDYPQDFVRMTYANLMSVSSSLIMDLPDVGQHVSEAAQFLRDEREIVDFGAVARPLSAILDEARAPNRIDLLSLDVEGAELDVLRGVDHERYRFDHMLVECRDVGRLDSYLVGVGYRRIAQLSAHDYLYVDDMMVAHR